MKKTYLILLILFATSYHVHANTITQTITLIEGWNAVFMELEPIQPEPGILLKDLPIDQVFTYYPQKTGVQFIQEPNEIDLKQAGWCRWVPSQQPDAFLNNIYRILPGQAYLIHSTSDYAWSLTGKACFKKIVWQPNSFNLKGFYVNPEVSPTFASYFENSNAHSQAIVYSLIDNHWQRLTDLETSFIDPGKAYWIYSKGGSDYNGPLQIELPLKANALTFNNEKLSAKIHFSNIKQRPLEITLQLIDTSMNFPIFSIQSTNSGKKFYQPFKTMTLNLLPQSQETISLAVRSGEISDQMSENVLKIYDDAGSLFYIPVMYKQN
ncbi:conserved hypothetical protein, secreted [Candidatus Magnetomorum sp. HK-1]|nr:conserved hypothetical protein, secreted [Candidatus Magnetomorum sp. HK-1]